MVSSKIQKVPSEIQNVFPEKQYIQNPQKEYGQAAGQSA
jgi:hypothetical protein